MAYVIFGLTALSLLLVLLVLGSFRVFFQQRYQINTMQHALDSLHTKADRSEKMVHSLLKIWTSDSDVPKLKQPSEPVTNDEPVESEPEIPEPIPEEEPEVFDKYNPARERAKDNTVLIPGHITQIGKSQKIPLKAVILKTQGTEQAFGMVTAFSHSKPTDSGNVRYYYWVEILSLKKYDDIEGIPGNYLYRKLKNVELNWRY